MKTKTEEKGRPSYEAWRSSYEYVLWGLFWAIVLVLAAKGISSICPIEEAASQVLGTFKSDFRYCVILRPLNFLLEHLGIGFFVSSVAVYFYEWGAHVKKLTDLMVYYKEEIEKQGILTERKGRDALSGCLEIMLSKGGTEKQKHLIIDMIEKIGDLSKVSGSAGERYASVVYSMLEELNHNTNSLLKLTRTDDADDVYTFQISAAHKLADAVLAAQMTSLGKEGSYTVVSDLTSWRKDQLLSFRKETRKAVLGGASVRRIFNLFLEGAINLSEEDVRNIINAHMRYSVEWSAEGSGRYDIALFGVDELKRLSVGDRFHAEREHFGVFARGGEVAQFEVREPDLSYIEIKKKVMQVHEKLFHEMWGAAKETRRVFVVDPNMSEEDRLNKRDDFLDYAIKRGRPNK